MSVSFLYLYILDSDAIEELKAHMTIAASSTLPERSFILAGQVQFYLNHLNDASDYAKKALTINPNSMGALSLTGWIELTLGSSKTCSFDKILERAPRDLDVYFNIFR
jgi:hypothetical protein